VFVTKVERLLMIGRREKLYGKNSICDGHRVQDPVSFRTFGGKLGRFSTKMIRFSRSRFFACRVIVLSQNYLTCEAPDRSEDSPRVENLDPLREIKWPVIEKFLEFKFVGVFSVLLAETIIRHVGKTETRVAVGERENENGSFIKKDPRGEERGGGHDTRHPFRLKFPSCIRVVSIGENNRNKKRYHVATIN